MKKNKLFIFTLLTLSLLFALSPYPTISAVPTGPLPDYVGVDVGESHTYKVVINDDGYNSLMDDYVNS